MAIGLRDDARVPSKTGSDHKTAAGKRMTRDADLTGIETGMGQVTWRWQKRSLRTGEKKNQSVSRERTYQPKKKPRFASMNSRTYSQIYRKKNST
jgi:hypothetical protein